MLKQMKEAIMYAEAMLRNLRGGNGQDSLGAVNRGNQYRTGEVQLKLAASEVPTEPLYLRGFAGGDYVGNGWEAADEETMFGEIARILDWEQWIRMIGGMYHSMYFVLNFDLDDGVSERTLHITHADADYGRVYIPYYSRSRWFWRESGGPGEEGYECEY